MSVDSHVLQVDAWCKACEESEFEGKVGCGSKRTEVKSILQHVPHDAVMVQYEYRDRPLPPLEHQGCTYTRYSPKENPPGTLAGTLQALINKVVESFGPLGITPDRPTAHTARKLVPLLAGPLMNWLPSSTLPFVDCSLISQIG